MRTRWILVFSSMLALSAANAQSPEDTARGKVLFDATYRCYTCHGYEAHGGMGPRLVSMKFPSAAFIAYVRNPRRMPAFSSKIIPDADLFAIWSYLKSLKESPRAADIPLLKEIMAH